MAAPVTVDEFLDLVRRSGLVDPQPLEGYLDRLWSGAATAPNTPGKLAQLLLRDGFLTRFQVEQLLQGRCQGFHLGKYRLLERLGQGGMGAVFLAVHVQLCRRVALKVLPADRVGEPAAVERFYREARAAAALDHPNIARAHDVDRDGPLHFLVMEYVDGCSLQDLVAARGKLDVGRAVAYVRQAALGLQHAHEARLVHRDVKPGNLLVDRAGTVKILDMGLARFFDGRGDNLTRDLGDGGLLGTADYIAPEQAMDSHAADIRADLYSLGATFYFLLAGHPPFPEGTTTQKLLAHQKKPPTPIRDLRPEVPEAVAAVVMRLLAKPPADRFQTPREVALALAPLAPASVPPPAAEDLPRLSPAAQEAATTLAGPRGPATGSGVSRLSGARLRAPETMAPRRREAASTTKVRAPKPPRSPVGVIIALAAAGLLSVSALIIYLMVAPAAPTRPGDPAAEAAATASATAAARARVAEGLVAAADFSGHEATVHQVGFSPDGQTLLTASADRSARLWDAVTGKGLLTLPHPDAVAGAAFSPDGKQVATACHDHLVRLWDVATGQVVRQFAGHQGPAQGVAFSPDGGRLLSAGADGTARVWDAATGQVVATFAGHGRPVVGAVFLAGGRQVLSAGADEKLRCWDAATGAEAWQAGIGPAHGVAAFPDGSYAVAAGADGRARFVNAATGKVLAAEGDLHGHAGAIRAVAVTPDGGRAVTAGADRTVRAWDVDGARELARSAAAAQPAACAAVSADGRFAVAGGEGGWVRLWRLPPRDGGERHRARLPGEPATAAGLLPDGRLFVAGGGKGTLAVWDAATGHLVRRWQGHGGGVTWIAVSPDGRAMVSAGADGLRRWDPATGEASWRAAGHDGAIHVVAFSPDGARLVSGGKDRTAIVWDAATGQELRRLAPHGGEVNGAAFLPGGRQVLTASADHQVRVWDVETGQMVRQFDGGLQAGHLTLAVTPDGRRAITGGSDKTLRWWDVADGRLLHTAPGHARAVADVAVSADGRHALTGDAAGAVKVWDAATGRPVRSLPGHAGSAPQVALSADGRVGVSCGRDGTVRLWDVDVTAGLAGHWPLDERQGVTAHDAAGPNPAAVRGGVTWLPDTRAGPAARFQGPPACLVVPDHPALNPTADLTLATWFLADAWARGQNPRLVQKGNGDNQYRLLAEDGQLVAHAGGWRAGARAAAPLPPAGGWHHAAMTYDGARVVLFVDGLAVAEGAHYGPLPRTADPLHLATKFATAPETDFLRGGLADVRLYHRALAASEVRALAHRPAGASLVAHWPLDDGAGAAARDVATGAYAGTLRGNPQWQPGKVGQALAFDGRQAAVETAFQQDLAAWTVAAWVQSPEAPGAGTSTGVVHREANLQICWDHSEARHRGAVALSSGGKWYAAGFGELRANTWYHLVGTFDGADLKAYANGKLIATTPVGGPVAAERLPLKIGGHAKGGAFFKGLVDDVRIYDRALLEDEVAALYDHPGTRPR